MTTDPREEMAAVQQATPSRAQQELRNLRDQWTLVYDSAVDASPRKASDLTIPEAVLDAAMPVLRHEAIRNGAPLFSELPEGQQRAWRETTRRTLLAALPELLEWLAATVEDAELTKMDVVRLVQDGVSMEACDGYDSGIRKAASVLRKLVP